MITGPWQTFRKRGENDKCTQDKSLGIFKLPIILAKMIGQNNPQSNIPFVDMPCYF
jgi:hypothetical protein